MGKNLRWWLFCLEKSRLAQVLPGLQMIFLKLIASQAQEVTIGSQKALEVVQASLHTWIYREEDPVDLTPLEILL